MKLLKKGKYFLLHLFQHIDLENVGGQTKWPHIFLSSVFSCDHQWGRCREHLILHMFLHKSFGLGAPVRAGLSSFSWTQTLSAVSNQKKQSRTTTWMQALRDENAKESSTDFTRMHVIFFPLAVQPQNTRVNASQSQCQANKKVLKVF